MVAIPVKALPLLELRDENAQPAAPPPPPPPRTRSERPVFHVDEPGGVGGPEAEYSVGDVSRTGISLG
jgi:hypothetical protein